MIDPLESRARRIIRLRDIEYTTLPIDGEDTIVYWDNFLGDPPTRLFQTELTRDELKYRIDHLKSELLHYAELYDLIEHPYAMVE